MLERARAAAAAGLLVGGLAGAPCGATDAPGGSPLWRDVDGAPLPFQSDEEVLDFLATAEVVETVFVGSGVTRPKKATLRREGITVHASFRYHHEEERNVTLADGRRELFFLDSYRNEVPAYRLARHLGLRHVPPTVLRKVDGRRGSLQIWVEGARTEKERADSGEPVPGALAERLNRQAWDMHVFDNLVRNIDRNAGNFLWDEDWRMWWIDCSRCFSRARDLPRPEKLTRVSRELWSALAALDRKGLDRAVGDFLYATQIRSILHRRDEIVEILGRRIAARGEEAVLFSRDAGP